MQDIIFVFLYDINQNPQTVDIARFLALLRIMSYIIIYCIHTPLLMCEKNNSRRLEV